MNIYVGNLNYNAVEDELQELFENYGKVNSVKIITDKYSGKSKGFGFIEMDIEDEAKAAISELNNTDFKGRNIVVNEARPRRT